MADQLFHLRPPTLPSATTELCLHHVSLRMLHGALNNVRLRRIHHCMRKLHEVEDYAQTLGLATGNSGDGTERVEERVVSFEGSLCVLFAVDAMCALVHDSLVVEDGNVGPG